MQCFFHPIWIFSSSFSSPSSYYFSFALLSLYTNFTIILPRPTSQGGCPPLTDGQNFSSAPASSPTPTALPSRLELAEASDGAGLYSACHSWSLERSMSSGQPPATTSFGRQGRCMHLLVITRALELVCRYIQYGSDLKIFSLLLSFTVPVPPWPMEGCSIHRSAQGTLRDPILLEGAWNIEMIRQDPADGTPGGPISCLGCGKSVDA